MSEQDAQDTTRPRAELRRWPVRIREARLIRRATVTPRMLRLTFGGPAMAGFESHIADEHVKLLFPEPFDDTSRIPVPDGDRLRWPRPIVPSRDYTVRRHDPAAGEVDIDVVAHEGGVASTWAREAAIGSTIWMAGPPRGVHVPDAFQWQALLGDETALPAIARRLAELPRDIRGVVVIEVADAAEEQPMDMPEGFEVRWLHRDGRPAGTTTLLADAAADIAIPAGGGAYVWYGGEQGMIRPLRAWVRRAGLERGEFDLTGYWRLGERGNQPSAGDVVHAVAHALHLTD